MGYTSRHTDKFSKNFIKYSGLLGMSGDWSLELGAGFGFTASEALKSGASIVVNDLEQSHLTNFIKKHSDTYGDRLVVYPGAFPENLEFNRNSFACIFSSKMFHFLDGPSIERGLEKCHNWLKNSGKLYILVDSVFRKNWSEFHSEFFKRKENKEKWPGWTDKISTYEGTRAQDLPCWFNAMDKDVLERAVINAQFEIEEITYISRPDYPADVRLDGRENIAIIARKTN